DFLPITLVAILTFTMGFIRGVHEGSSLKKSLLGALMCTLLATPLFPVFLWIAESQGWPPIIAFPPCVFLAFLGTDWIRSKADDIYEVFIGRWRK
ncbi:phage holin family protein, partial [Halomonas sp. IOP_14]|uniref:phage holin family protein n=1 Tax=Halomonas sp. IOP_14 TaxID=2873295 RepID=UPI001E300E80